jgi:hypothetical protein
MISKGQRAEKALYLIGDFVLEVAVLAKSARGNQ